MKPLYGQADVEDRWQREMRDTILIPQFYEKQFDHFVPLDGMGGALKIQIKLGMDTIVRSRKNGEAICIEEKFSRYRADKGAYDAFAIEEWDTDKPGWWRKGWIYTSKADQLLYCFETAEGGLDCYLMDLPALRAWFTPLAPGLHKFTRPDLPSGPSGRVVPIKMVMEALQAAGTKPTRHQLQPRQEIT